MQASRCHALWILAILALMAWPPSVAAVGEYDGVWIGTETVYVEGESPETLNTETKIALILVERAKASPWIPLLLGDRSAARSEARSSRMCRRKGGFDSGSFSETCLPESETYAWGVYFAPKGIFVALQYAEVE